MTGLASRSPLVELLDGTGGGQAGRVYCFGTTYVMAHFSILEPSAAVRDVPISSEVLALSLNVLFGVTTDDGQEITRGVSFG